MALNYIERSMLENQANVCTQRGSVNSDGKIKKFGDAFSVFVKIKGSTKYWQQAKNELIAKVQQLGPFHVFFTLSCAEMRWPEVFVSVLKKLKHRVVYGLNGAPWTGRDDDIYVIVKRKNKKGKIEDKPVKLWDFVDNDMDKSRYELLKDHTILITRMFNKRVQSFVKNILMKQGKDKINFCYHNFRIEFQLRGLPHIHGVLWINDEWLKAKGWGKNDEDDEKIAIDIANFLISVEIPEDDEDLKERVLAVQTHKHTATCRKRGAERCRFGFPKLPSERTIIAKPLPEEEEEDSKKDKYKRYTEILLKAREYLESENMNEDLTLDEFLDEIGEKKEEYYKALSTTKHGKVMILKRSVKERFVNNYNKAWMMAWNANMDVQVAFDPYSVIAYLIDYINKDETEERKFLKEAFKLVKDQPLQDQFRALSTTYLTHRQVGASEAFYRLEPGLHLKESNISCLFVATGFPENRSKFFMKVPEKTDGDVDKQREIDGSLPDRF